MTDNGDLRAVVLGAIQRLEAERDEALARAEAAEACAKESAEIMRRQRDRLEGQRDVALARAMEAERLLSEYRRESGCTRGQRTTQWCGEVVKLRRAWLSVIQAENSCPATGGGCFSKRCGCVAEMETLIQQSGTNVRRNTSHD